MNQKPVHEIKNGNIRAVIWHNTGKDGKQDHHSVLLMRRFRMGDVWRETTSLFRGDVAKAIDVLSKAEQWVTNREPTVA